ncbi:MAG: FKBP-type peptidyl-prolyl cis-trans isomerase [Pseudomonadota bacterium]
MTVLRSVVFALGISALASACQTLPLPGGNNAAPVKIANPCPVYSPGAGPFAPPFPVNCDTLNMDASGLRWIEIAAGDPGTASPTPGSTVVVDYEGFLANSGQRIDSSYARGESAVFDIDTIISGWGAILQRMSPGDEWLVLIPSDLAYGSEPRGNVIPANSDLVFRMRLQGFLTPEQLAEQAAAATAAPAPQATEPARVEVASGPDMAAWQSYFPWVPNAPGVNTLPSGVSYVRLERGNSPKRNAILSDEVLVHYEGRLAETSAFFDSSWSTGQPVRFPVDALIPGFTEVLTYMGEGDRVLVHIPSELGYGARGAGEDIPPNSDLMFQINMIAIFPEGE